MTTARQVYFFGEGKADGRADMKARLGGKGADLAAMAGLGMPILPGFTISTDVCNRYHGEHDARKGCPPDLVEEVEANLRKVEEAMGRKFGDAADPLLLSIRAGARTAMPGTMETLFNIGLNSGTIPGLIAQTGKPRFVYDLYRKLILTYADVVMEGAAGIEVEFGKGIRRQCDRIKDELKERRGIKDDADLSAADLRELCDLFKARVKRVFGKPFPDDPMEQLWGAVSAAFQCWRGRRAIRYRRIEKIPDSWGIAVHVQATVFGNTGNTSGFGVAATRDPATGRKGLRDKWLPNGEDEDFVNAEQYPHPPGIPTKRGQVGCPRSLRAIMPHVYAQLREIGAKLERRYRDAVDMEFTVEKGRLFLLHYGPSRRTGTAAVNVAVDAVREGLISRNEAVTRVSAHEMREAVAPRALPGTTQPVGRGIPAWPGATSGVAVFDSHGSPESTLPEAILLIRDLHGSVDGMIERSGGVVGFRGGMTSNVAISCRRWDKPFVLRPRARLLKRTLVFPSGARIKAGAPITIDGNSGAIYDRRLPVRRPLLNRRSRLGQFVTWLFSIKAGKADAKAKSRIQELRAIVHAAYPHIYPDS